MAKLFLFGIGGTGSRVIKAATMLFASGVKLESGFDSVVPILIDPDTANGDLNRTKKILTKYQEIRLKTENPNGFFAQRINTVENLVNNIENIKPSGFEFKLSGTSNQKFKDYIGYNNLDDIEKNFISGIFSKSNLESELDVGFKGNPNMGSIVLNQFTKSKDYESFGNAFAPGDAVFIVSSIFGGTGAAGFPLLLKTLNHGNDIPNSAIISKAIKGNLTILPYFQLENGEIESDTFIEKTKTALEYYNRTIIDSNQINSICFIGDYTKLATYENNSGSVKQKNNAHFIELAGALSILDFCKNISSFNGNTVVKEFGIAHDDEPISFHSLGMKTNDIIENPFKKFMIFSNYLKHLEGLQHAIGLTRWTSKKTTLNKNYFGSPMFKDDVISFVDYWTEWINELGHNNPSFIPFDKSIFEEATHFKKLDIFNNLLLNKADYSKEKIHTQFIKLFDLSTDKLIEKEII